MGLVGPRDNSPITMTLNVRVRSQSEVLCGDHDSSSMQASTENPRLVHKPLHQSLNKDLVKIIHSSFIKYTPAFPSVDLRTGQTGNLSESACGLWLLGSPDIRNCFHTPKKETGDVTTNDLNLVDVLSSKIVSSSLKKMLAVSGKVNITFVYISPSQN